MKSFNNNIKIFLSWTIGIISLVLCTKFFNIILQNFNVPTYIDFGETITVTRGSGRYSYEEDISGEYTSVGTALNFLSIMIATRIGMAFYTKKINGNVSKAGNIDFMAYFFGLLIYGILATIFFIILNRNYSGLLNFLEFALAGIIFYFFKNWRDKKIIKLNTKTKKL